MPNFQIRQIALLERSPVNWILSWACALFCSLIELVIFCPAWVQVCVGTVMSSFTWMLNHGGAFSSERLFAKQNRGGWQYSPLARSFDDSASFWQKIVLFWSYHRSIITCMVNRIVLLSLNIISIVHFKADQFRFKRIQHNLILRVFQFGSVYQSIHLKIILNIHNCPWRDTFASISGWLTAVIASLGDRH